MRNSLLAQAVAVLADPELMPSRLVRGCFALAFTACVLAVASSQHRLLDTVKGGGELSYTALAMERELIVYSSLLAQAVAVGPC